MVNRQRRRFDRETNSLSHKGVPRVPIEAPGVVRNVGQVRVEVFRPGIFLLHNAHLKSWAELGPAKGCALCGSQVATPPTLVESFVSAPEVGPGDRADEVETTTPSSNGKLWPWE